MSFDTLAPHYRWMEFILAGSKLQRCRTAWLDQITDATDILLLGEGNGRFLPLCREQFPGARITCVDASARMIEQSQQRLTRAGDSFERISFVHADVLAWNPRPGAYDLIATNFFLDCFRADQLERVVRAVGRAARPKANWLLADFQTAASGAPRLRSEVILRMMYAFFRVATRLSARQLTSPDPFLDEAGFVLRRRRQSEWGLLHSDWWQRG